MSVSQVHRDAVGRAGHLGIEITGLNPPGISRKTAGMWIFVPLGERRLGR